MDPLGVRVEHGFRWEKKGDRWVLYDGERELGWVGERLLGWTWLVREGGNGARMGMVDSRADAMAAVMAQARALHRADARG